MQAVGTANLPGLQERQTDAPEVDEYEPMHGVGDNAGFVQADPAGHGVHSVALIPAGPMQEVALCHLSATPEVCPTTHVAPQPGAPIVQHTTPAQAMPLDIVAIPEPRVYVPGLHDWHIDAPGTVE